MTEKPEEIWITHNPDFPNKHFWYEHGNDTDNYTPYVRKDLTPPQDVLRQVYEVLEFYADFDPDLQEGLYGDLNEDGSSFMLDEGDHAKKALALLSPYLTRQQENE